MNQIQTMDNRPSFMKGFSLAICRLIRWRIIGSFPPIPKYLVIGAPHTSNWDFFYLLLVKGVTGVNLHWVGKDSLFHWPIGGLMRWLGGIPVNRRKRNNFVDQIVALYAENSQLVVGVTPEGTRSKSSYWRSGFYYMALGARIPIQLIGIDYRTRTLEIGTLLSPSGDIERDFAIIQNFYSDRKGKYPHKQGAVVLNQVGSEP